MTQNLLLSTLSTGPARHTCVQDQWCGVQVRCAVVWCTVVWCTRQVHQWYGVQARCTVVWCIGPVYSGVVYTLGTPVVWCTIK